MGDMKIERSIKKAYKLRKCSSVGVGGEFENKLKIKMNVVQKRQIDKSRNDWVTRNTLTPKNICGREKTNEKKIDGNSGTALSESIAWAE